MFSKLISLMLLVLIPAVLLAQGPPKTTQNTPYANMDYKQMGAPMPSLTFLAYNDTTAANKAVPTRKEKRENRRRSKPVDTVNSSLYSVVTDKDLDNGGNLLVMMFNPTCLHCEDMTFLFEKHVDLFRKSRLVLLANKVMAPYIPDFTERHHVARYPSMYIGYDSSGFIDNVFLYQTLPQINIYSGERKLLKTYCGDVSIDSLKKYIH